jgi:hypothetical protein
LTDPGRADRDRGGANRRDGGLVRRSARRVIGFFVARHGRVVGGGKRRFIGMAGVGIARDRAGQSEGESARMPHLEFTVVGPPVSHQTRDKANLLVWKNLIRAEAAKNWGAQQGLRTRFLGDLGQYTQ